MTTYLIRRIFLFFPTLFGALTKIDFRSALIPQFDMPREEVGMEMRQENVFDFAADCCGVGDVLLALDALRLLAQHADVEHRLRAKLAVGAGADEISGQFRAVFDDNVGSAL